MTTPNYRNKSIIGAEVATDDGGLDILWRTPDDRFYIYQRAERGESYFDVLEYSPRRVGDEAMRMQWVPLVIGANKSEVQELLGLILYPPGSVPSPEPATWPRGPSTAPEDIDPDSSSWVRDRKNS